MTTLEETLRAKLTQELEDVEGGSTERDDGLVDRILAMVRNSDAQVIHTTQDPKYSIRNNRLINAERNEDIPMDEPGFWIRARDLYGEAGVFGYMGVIRHAASEGDVPVAHLEAVRRRLDDFQKFRLEHPDRMKRPDTDPPKSQNSGVSGHQCTGAGCSICSVMQGDVRFRQQGAGPLTDEEMPS